MTKKEGKNCLDSLPKDYEVIEKPDTCVMFIRKKKESKFKKVEIQQIEQELKNNQMIDAFKLDVVNNMIKIYIAEKEDNERLFQLWEKPFYSKDKINELRTKFMRFEEKMRILKKSAKNHNEYEFQRFCYRGAIDDWISINGGNNLKELAKENIYHLGKESYFELF